MSEQAEVIVIGAGIGGLTAAALLQERGIRTVVFEKNAFPGGSCASSAGTVIHSMPVLRCFTVFPIMRGAAP